MMNSIGLQNIGVRAFVAAETAGAARLRQPRFSPMFSAMRWRITCEVVRVLEDAEGVAGYELNVSCPNTKHGGMFFSSDPALLAEVVGAVRRISEAATDREAVAERSGASNRLAQAAADAGADAISLVNTFVALAIDAQTRRPRLGAGFGGLSGPAIKPIALRMVYEAAQAVKDPGDRAGRHRHRRGRGRVSDCGRFGRRGGHGRISGIRRRRSASRGNWTGF